MTSKFGALAANVSDAFKVEIIDPISDAVLKDKDGQVAFIEILSSDSDAGRAFDKEQRAVHRRKAMKSQPIQARKPYELRFDVGQKRAEAFAAVSGVGRAIQEAAGDDKFVTILVVLEPGDFTLYGVDSLEIVVPRKINAPSKNAASFTIEAKKEGTGTLNAIFYINGNMFQKLTMTIQVGGRRLSATAQPLTPEESGRAMARYALRHPRTARRLMRVCGLDVDGTADDYHLVGRDHVPFVRLVPAGPPE